MIRQASVFACAACLLIATPAMSQAAAAVAPLRTAGAADLAAGKRVFDSQCAWCHGTNRAGGSGPMQI